ncbi:hypothetical protein [Nonomuraea cavernae]|uniref:hypothetical protein n=1 Tax=Nonomuraea cavernae TaxID=2045107 RepID=UPI001669F31B|nr:hypothetical protein [Nonomuraea cavernae]MCA2185011.1 hypothetical protein [Nonomuraea cavernae]
MAGNPTMADTSAPAWADGGDGFLDSGWSSDDSGPRRRRGRRKPPPGDALVDEAPGGGRARVALLSVAAVAVVLGGTVAGVKLMSGPGDTACPGDRCTAVQTSNQPAPVVSDPVEEEESPIDEPTEDEQSDAADTPTPQNTTSARAPRRTSSPEPTPTKTKERTPAKQTDEPVPTDFEENATEEPTVEPTTINDPGGTTTDAPPATPEPTVSATVQSALSGGSVNVRFDVVRQGVTGYTAHLDVVNASPMALKSLTVSLPVAGRVVSMTGGEWTQDGNLLIIDLSGSLVKGGSTEVKFSATGRAGRPGNCGLVGGECAVN